ncbi:hypothetical protein BLNAU_7948 [Blattamonas nauphoetae]|uniref:Uncharacterized protein n=1 Tax=Blattamonas nauphoetae TaxID=2049346 RepID=A0ABQ9Y062_9EUKA|nr:hypothetical protein BLNAU_7948 [Blattamonas nauphoetae]
MNVRDETIAAQIRQLQEQRRKASNALVELGSKEARFDTHLFGSGPDKSEYVSSIPADDAEDSDYVDHTPNYEKGDWKTTARSYSSGYRFQQEMAMESREPEEVMKPQNSKRIVDNESSYQAKWRDIRLSPPRKDAFRSSKDDASSYKEIIKQRFLEKDSVKFRQEIQKQKREESTKTITDAERRNIADEMLRKAGITKGRDEASRSPSTTPPDHSRHRRESSHSHHKTHRHRSSRH